MAIVWRNRDLNDLKTVIHNLPARAEKNLTSVVKESSREGARLMREYILTRGTGYRGHTGRVETGKMLASVTNTATRSGNSVRGSWGWLRTQEDYFRYQENGFRAFGSNAPQAQVEPMHALLDSFFKVREDFIADVAKEMRK